MSEIWSYPISRSLPTLKLHTWIPLESQLSQEDLKKMEGVKKDKGRTGKRTNPATNGMKGSVTKQKRNVEETMFVTSVEKGGIEKRIAGVTESFLKRPRYLQKSM